MPTLREVAEPLQAIFTVVPKRGEGVCAICHGAPNPRFDVCYSCQEAISQVSRPLELVVPISLSRVDEQLHYVLRSYKNVSNPDVQRKFRVQVAATVGLFLSRHGGCIRTAAGRSWDALTVVPSSSGRAGPHPLIQTLRLIERWDQGVVETMRTGATRIGHNQADDGGFEVIADVGGRSMLLVDDTLTSSARLQSAASALTLAGADVVAGVVVGRVINPDFNQAAKELWERYSRMPFSFDSCCLEYDPMPA